MYTRESPRSHIARAYIPDLAARTTAAYKLPNFLGELVQKVEKGRQNRQDGMKGRRGKAACTIEYLTNLVSAQISLTARAE